MTVGNQPISIEPDLLEHTVVASVADVRLSTH
jgi:hypothetical protein